MAAHFVRVISHASNARRSRVSMGGKMAKKAVKRAVARRALKKRAVKRAVVKRAIKRAILARALSERMGGEGSEM